MIDYSLILTAKYSGSEWTLNGDDYEGLTWLSDSQKPTKKQLDDLWPATLDALTQKAAEAAAARQAILDRLGITAEEAKLLLG